MAKIAIRGLAAVFREGRYVDDPATLASLVPYTHEDDDLFSAFLGDAATRSALAEAIAPSGRMRFDYDGESTALRVSVVYDARRTLTESELRELADYTLGQWSDGIAENGVTLRSGGVEYLIQVIFHGDGLPDEYPWVDLEEE